MPTPEDPIKVADHTLVRHVDKGSYGEVWLARTALGTIRAVKIIRRSGFATSEPYERELRGIRAFEPISRSHPGFVPVLQVGWEEDFFYCVMEVADDLSAGQAIIAQDYVPKTLDRFRAGKALPLEECLRLGLQLSDAVARLHDAQLVHRDIKPSNIVFVHGYPKLADIGLVTHPNLATSLVGTIGFIPPEGCGKAQADVFALGKVLYECATGLDRSLAPDLPLNDPEATYPPLLMEIMAVITRAIHPNPEKRYATARALHADLMVIENGRSVLRLRALEGMWSRAKRLAALMAILALIGGTAYSWHSRERKLAERTLQQEIGAATVSGILHWDEQNYGEALESFSSVSQKVEDSDIRTGNLLRWTSTLARMPKLSMVRDTPAAIYSMDVSQDGSTVAVGLAGGRLQLRSLPSLDLKTEGQCGNEDVLACSFHPDNQSVAMATAEGTIQVLDCGTHRVLRTWQTPQPTALSFAPKTNLLLIGSAQGSFTVWDFVSGQLVESHTLGKEQIDAIASAQGRAVVVSRDGTVYVFNTQDFSHPELTLNNPSSAISVALSQDGSRLAVGFFNGQVHVWSLDSRTKVLPPLIHDRGVTSVAFAPDGSMLLTACFDGFVRAWNLITGQEETSMLPQGAPIRSAKFCSDSRRILAAGYDGSLREWDLAGILNPLKIPRNAKLLGNDLWAWCNPQSNQLLLRNKQGLSTFQLAGQIETIEVTPDQRHLLTLSEDSGKSWVVQSIDVGARHFLEWAVKTTEKPAVFSGNESFSIATSNRTECFSISSGSTISLLSDLPIQASHVVCPKSFNSWGAACYGSNVTLFNGTNRLHLPHNQSIGRASLSPSGTLLAVCTRTADIESCYVQVWSVLTGAPISPQLRHSDGVIDAAWSRDEKRLITATEAGIGVIWDTRSWTAMPRKLKNHQQLLSLAVGGNPEMIAMGSKEGTLRLWDLHTGFPLCPPLQMSYAISDVKIVEGGLLATEHGGDTWFWAMPELNQGGVEKLRQISTLLSASPDDGTPPSQHTASWNRLRTKYPALFETSSEEAGRWHQVRADIALVNRHGPLELHHMQKLVELQPEAFGASNQLANALVRAKQLTKD